MCMYVCMYVCIYVCMHVCMYTCMYVCMYVCMSYVYHVHVCTYVRMCMYVYIYIYVIHLCDSVIVCGVCVCVCVCVCACVCVNARNSQWWSYYIAVGGQTPPGTVPFKPAQAKRMCPTDTSIDEMLAAAQAVSSGILISRFRHNRITRF